MLCQRNKGGKIKAPFLACEEIAFRLLKAYLDFRIVQFSFKYISTFSLLGNNQSLQNYHTLTIETIYFCNLGMVAEIIL